MRDKTPVTPFEDVFTNFYAKVESYSESQWRTRLIGGSVISVILIVLASLPFQLNDWIYATIGTPAGIILFLLGLASIHRYGWADSGAFNIRQEKSFLQRLKIIGVVGALTLVVLLSVGKYIPYGVGGVLIVIGALTAVTVARKTEYENELTRKGLPDPRDLDVEEDEEEFPAPVQEESDPSQVVSGKLT